MSTFRSGELFAGVGGLGMAVNEVFRAVPAWFCEFDAAPSKVLAHHYPGVPNFGDVTKVDWASTPRVNVLAGGFPCQDVSLAGRRAGMKDGTRSGLWSEYLKAITQLRPDWVVIENVRGLYSARADSEMEPCTWCLGDGADEYHLRALDAVLADLSAVGFDAEWTGLRAADVGAPHGRFRVFILAWPRERTVPDAARVGRGEGRAKPEGATGGSDDELSGANHSLTLLATPRVSSANGHGDLTRRRASTNIESQVMLLPTPDAYAGSRGGSQHPDKKRAGNHMVTLQDVAEFTLLPTPVTEPETGNGHARDLGSEVRLLPTPNTMEHLPVREGEARERAFKRGDMNGSMRSQEGNLRERVVEELAGVLLPTPTVGDKGGTAARSGDGFGAPLGEVTRALTDWGPYESAIRRWEAVTGRPAPAPVRFDGKGGKPRLNPELTEWMMGWPAGWVTDPVICPREVGTPEPFVNKVISGLSRAEQLKACGNGVVPQQAAAALRILLARPGVPSIERKVAV